MKKKSITFCFLKLKAKEKASFSKFIQERVIFFVEHLGLSFQSYYLIIQLPIEVVVMASENVKQRLSPKT